jgi:YD repeat-containing protein
MVDDIDQLEKILFILRQNSAYIDRSKFHIIMDVTYPLSDYFVDWEKSILKKDYFLNKFEILKKYGDWCGESYFNIDEEVKGCIDMCINNIYKYDVDDIIMLDNDIPEGPSYANKVYATSDSGAKEWRDIADLAEPIGKKRSIEDDNGELQLVGDEDDPGENQLYGTDENGDRGWQDLKTIPITDFNWQNPDTLFEYNDDNDIIRVIFADGRYQTFDYTEDGNIEAEHYYDDSDNLLFSYEYTYDTNGNITLQDYVAG